MNRWTKSSWLCDSLGQLLLQICIKKKINLNAVQQPLFVPFQGIKYPTTSLWGKPCIAKKIKKMFFSPCSGLTPLRTPPAAIRQSSKPGALLRCAGWAKQGWLPSVLRRSWVWTERSPLAVLQNSRQKNALTVHFSDGSGSAAFVLSAGSLTNSQQFLTSFECKVLHKL